MSPNGCIDGIAGADFVDAVSADAILGAERLRAGRLRAGEVPVGAAAAFLAMVIAPVVGERGQNF